MSKIARSSTFTRLMLASGVIAILASIAIAYFDDREGFTRLNPGAVQALGIVVSAWVGILTLLTLWHSIQLSTEARNNAEAERKDRARGSRLLVLNELDMNFQAISTAWTKAFHLEAWDATTIFAEPHLYYSPPAGAMRKLFDFGFPYPEHAALNSQLGELTQAFTEEEVGLVLLLHRMQDQIIRALDVFYDDFANDRATKTSRFKDIHQLIYEYQSNRPRLS